MGCSGVWISPDYNYDKINDPLNFVLKPLESIRKRSIINNEVINSIFDRASDIMKLIEKQRENVIDKFDQVILATGASVYINPNISHCLRCLLFKIAYDLNGDIQSANITHIEDTPYISIVKHNLQPDTIEAIDLFFNYIEDVNRSKLAISQIENIISELIYFLNENEFPEIPIIEDNKKKIDNAVKVFPQIKQFITNLLQKYQYELYLFLIKNKSYSERVDFIGKEARREKEKDKMKDIHQVAYIYKRVMKEYPLEYKQEEMAFSIEIGKVKFIDIINSKKRNKEKIYNQLLIKEKSSIKAS